MEQSSFKSSIPEAKITAVEKALQTAFNTTTIENIELLTGGLSGAIVYKIIVGGKPYALRLIMRIDPLNDPVRHGAREISLMSYEGQLLFGKVILNEILHNMKTPRFAESINKMR